MTSLLRIYSETHRLRILSNAITFLFLTPVTVKVITQNYNARYFMTGLADFLKIKQVAQQYQLDLNSYLDFGCASGRVLRHFCAQSEIPNLWGSDINGRHIRWLNDYMPPRLKLVHNNLRTSTANR